jgi:hypothetical protein
MSYSELNDFQIDYSAKIEKQFKIFDYKKTNNFPGVVIFNINLSGPSLIVT